MAKKTVQPTSAEKKIIRKRLRTKYPQMFKKGAGAGAELIAASIKRKHKKKKISTVRTKAITKRLKQIGLSDNDIARLRKQKEEKK